MLYFREFHSFHGCPNWCFQSTPDRGAHRVLLHALASEATLSSIGTQNLVHSVPCLRALFARQEVADGRGFFFCFFDVQDVARRPPNAVYHLNACFVADTHPGKLNLGVTPLSHGGRSGVRTTTCSYGFVTWCVAFSLPAPCRRERRHRRVPRRVLEAVRIRGCA